MELHFKELEADVREAGAQALEQGLGWERSQLCGDTSRSLSGAHHPIPTLEWRCFVCSSWKSAFLVSFTSLHLLRARFARSPLPKRERGPGLLCRVCCFPNFPHFQNMKWNRESRQLFPPSEYPWPLATSSPRTLARGLRGPTLPLRPEPLNGL